VLHLVVFKLKKLSNETDNNIAVDEDEEEEEENVEDMEEEEEQEDLEDDDDDNDNARPEGTITYDVDLVNRITKSKKPFYSHPIFVRNLPWRIKIVPGSRLSGSVFGVLVQCLVDEVGGDMLDDPQQQQSAQIQSTSSCNNNYNLNWSCKAVATFRLMSFKPGVEPHTKKICHTFHSKESESGVKDFIQSGRLQDSARGYLKMDDRKKLMGFEVEIQADIPLGCDLDARKCTGYVGLRNQGATCYSNHFISMILQYLIF
jgi:MATH domain